jgi:hypothetical protein
LQLFISKPERSLSFPVFADDMNIYRVVIIWNVTNDLFRNVHGLHISPNLCFQKNMPQDVTRGR